MLCADTNCWIAYLSGEEASDLTVLDLALKDKTAVMAPIVLSELLSDPGLDPALAENLQQIQMIEFLPNYWARAGRLRARLLRRGYKPGLADTLIAQLCIDHNLPLLTRDRGFGAFSKTEGLVLL